MSTRDNRTDAEMLAAGYERMPDVLTGPVQFTDCWWKPSEYEKGTEQTPPDEPPVKFTLALLRTDPEQRPIAEVCNTCGAFIGNTPAHRAWHGQQGKS